MTTAMNIKSGCPSSGINGQHVIMVTQVGVSTSQFIPDYRHPSAHYPAYRMVNCQKSKLHKDVFCDLNGYIYIFFLHARTFFSLATL